MLEALAAATVRKQTACKLGQYRPTNFDADNRRKSSKPLTSDYKAFDKGFEQKIGARIDRLFGAFKRMNEGNGSVAIMDKDDELNDAIFNPVDGLPALLLRTLEDRLQLPQSYIMRLREEPSDWVFIVKLGLLVEATLTEYIVQELGDPRLQEHMSNSDNANRLKLALKLDLISLEDRNLLMMLAEVRNQFVHRIENLNRTLEAYLLEQPDHRLKDIEKVLTDAATRRQLRNDHILARDWVPQHFRSKLLMYVIGPLVMMSMSRDRKERVRERAEWERLTPLQKATFEFKHPYNKMRRAKELKLDASDLNEAPGDNKNAH